MSTIIEPTVGRIVWYRAEDGAIRAAIVVGVNSTFNLNLHVFGYSSSDLVAGMKDSVTHADPDIEPGCKPSWHWMPYQKQRAEKHATEAVLADEPKVGGQLVGNGLNPHFGGRFEGETAEQARDRRATAASPASDTTTAAAVDNVRQRPLPGANLPPHQKRVIDEKCELDERKDKLEAFFETPTFAQLDDVEQGRLHAQRNAMAAYSRILGERISAFAGGADADLGASTPG
jgi:hypothetical protein